MSMDTRAQPEAASIVGSSTYFGACTAAIGATFFAGYATLKGRPPILWSAAGGAQCFVLGSTFWFSRSVLRHNTSQAQPLSRRDDLVYSSLAGSAAGMVGGAIRGRANIIPGAIVLGLMGLGGQASYSAVATMMETPSETRPLLDRLSDSKWWPLKSISDADYEQELSEKIIALEAEMAMIDEKIVSVKQEHSKTSSSR